jgi:hypothetical protein
MDETGDTHSEAQRAAETPTVFTTIESFAVSCLPPDHIDAESFTIRVENAGHDRWAVRRGGRRCLNATGTWDHEPIPSERDDDWLSAHRFDLDTALRHARDMAPRVTVNGHTVEQVLEVRLP